MDSGAFSARTKETSINVVDYTNFCNEVEPYVDHIIALDVINSGEESQKNYDYMMEHLSDNAQFKLIPVYHTTEPYSILEHYLKKTDYIAIGAYREIKPNKRKFWNYVANILEQIPKDKKIHLLGVNSPNLLFLFGNRLESVDNTSMSKRAGDTNKVFNYSGMPVSGKGFIKGRVGHSDREFLNKFNVYREQKFENELNGYLRRKRE